MPPLETSNIDGTASGAAAVASSVGATAAATAVSDRKVQQPQSAQAAPKVPVEQVVQQLNDIAESHSQSVEFSINRSAGNPRVIITMRDTQTNEVIHQIPSEEMIAIDDAITRMQGALVKKTA